MLMCDIEILQSIPIQYSWQCVASDWLTTTTNRWTIGLNWQLLIGCPRFSSPSDDDVPRRERDKRWSRNDVSFLPLYLYLCILLSSFTAENSTLIGDHAEEIMGNEPPPPAIRGRFDDPFKRFTWVGGWSETAGTRLIEINLSMSMRQHTVIYICPLGHVRMGNGHKFMWNLHKVDFSNTRKGVLGNPSFHHSPRSLPRPFTRQNDRPGDCQKKDEEKIELQLLNRPNVVVCWVAWLVALNNHLNNKFCHRLLFSNCRSHILCSLLFLAVGGWQPTSSRNGNPLYHPYLVIPIRNHSWI